MGYNMKDKGNFNFGNKGNFDFKTVTKDQSVADHLIKKKSPIEKSYTKKAGTPGTGKYTYFAPNAPMYGSYKTPKFKLATNPKRIVKGNKPSIFTKKAAPTKFMNFPLFHSIGDLMEKFKPR